MEPPIAVLDRQPGAALPPRHPAIRALMAKAHAHPAVRHPYLRALERGALPDPRGALADFAQTYRHYSAWFPRYLVATMDALRDPRHRALIAENLVEEGGAYDDAELAELASLGVDSDWVVGVPHPRLFDRFCEALGVGAPDEASGAAVAFREGLLGFLEGATAAQAVGAIGLGTESVVATIYQPFVGALKRLPLHPRDTVFFTLHTAVDDHHARSLLDISAELASAPDGLGELEEGMQVALTLRLDLWDQLFARARAMDRAAT